MPRRRALAITENLKTLLGSNGLAWADQDHVLPKRAQDVAVRQGLHNLLGLAAPLRRADVQAEMITVFEQAARLFFEKRGRGQEINEVDFVREVWAGHRLYLYLGDYYFAQLFAALLRARSEYHEGRFQRAPQPPLLGMAIDTFADASRGFFGGEILSLYIDQGVMGVENGEEEGERKESEQATALRSFNFSAPGPSRPTIFAGASASSHATPLAGAASLSAISVPGPARAFIESPKYDSDEFAGVSASEDEEEDGGVEDVAVGVEAMVLDEDGDIAMGE